MNMEETYKDINVNVRINVDLENIEMVDPMVPNVEQVAYGIQQYLIDNGDFDFSWKEISRESSGWVDSDDMEDDEDHIKDEAEESEELVELSEEERTILENLDDKWVFIMRDGFDDKLKVSNYRPAKMSLQGNKNNGRWGRGLSAKATQTGISFLNFTGFDHLFKFVTWNDGLPYRISDLLMISSNQEEEEE